MLSAHALHDRLLHQAPFALRVVRRKGGRAAIVYRREANASGQDRLQRLGALSPLAYSAAQSLLLEAVRQSGAPSAAPQPAANGLTPGPFLPLDASWGARVACYALLAAGLRDGARLLRVAEHLYGADGAQAAWWLGTMLQDEAGRALRAFRILTEAVQ